jgi:glucose-6-phosphate isomerase
MTASELWERYQKHLSGVPAAGLTMDVSRMEFDAAFLESMEPAMQRAFSAMQELEAGSIANKDEHRMVGHYWLRAPSLAPTPEITAEIRQTLAAVKDFAAQVHDGRIKPPSAERFTRVLAIGIGGSALGPMCVADALGSARSDPMEMHFADNTDPDGIARLLAGLGDGLRETLCLVTSKSGKTPETRNGMLLAGAAYAGAGLRFEQHAVAITMRGSHLDEAARSQGWLARFPMYEWVGGRTSQLSTVGLLPAALQGLDIDGLLAGAAECDKVTRVSETRRNPAALLALMWYAATDGRGAKDMVVIPYKDRLLLFSRYLQQLIMESLGKRMDVNGNVVEQGITVYGNKGSTDQHAYVQQLRDGVNNFFVVFIRVLESGGSALEVDPGVTAGDYLNGFLMGTREALYENGRQSITITIPRVDARSVGALIALFERAVGFYATLVHINAYHQPGVEAGKKAAEAVLKLQSKVLAALSEAPRTADEIAQVLGDPGSAEKVFWLLEHLSANGRAQRTGGATPATATFRA